MCHGYVLTTACSKRQWFSLFMEVEIQQNQSILIFYNRKLKGTNESYEKYNLKIVFGSSEFI